MDVRLRYTVRKRGKLFWQPTPEMKALGFLPKALGLEGPESIAEARRLAEAWDEARADLNPVSRYPEGSFGEYWDRLRGTKTRKSLWWSKKAPRTREDYERGWVYIDAWRPPDKLGRPGHVLFSHKTVTTITTEMCEQFYAHMEQTASPRERWRAVKTLKILLEDARVRLKMEHASPASGLANPQPPGRTSIWLGAEVEEMSAVAAIAGFEGMSLAIEVGWETMFSPVDVRTLRPRQMKRDTAGYYFHRTRTKTQADAFGYVSDDLAARILAYVEQQDRAQADDTPIFRTRPVAAGMEGGRPREAIPYKDKDVFAKDFRLVREIAFPGDERQFLDIRRSANVEADAAGADKRTMGELLANGLADSKFLEDTYTPPTVAKAREVAAQRAVGRARLAGEVTRLRSAN